MKQLLALTAFTLLIACSGSASDKQGGEVAEETAPSARGDLYLRTYMWTGTYGTTLDISWIYMDNAGNIVKNPKHGVNPVDLEKEKKDNAKNTGTYKIQGDKIVISFADGKTASWRFDKKGDAYSGIDGGITTKQTGLPKNFRIDGKYASSVVLPNVSGSSTLVFSKDGTFTSSNYGTVTTPEDTGESKSGKTGTYDITGNTLTMKFPDGKVEKSVITIWDMDGRKHLVINNRHYPQEK